VVRAALAGAARFVPNFLAALEDTVLILSRKLGQSVLIGDDIVIRIVELRSSRVRIGIDAPADVRIRREEHLSRERADLEQQVGAIDDLTFGDELLLGSASGIC
jgi:carbon storage regulator